MGNYYDTDSSEPGTQPPQPKGEPERKPQPGRLVSQLVKTVENLDSWRADWAAAETGHLRGEQRERYKQAVAELKANVADLPDELG